MVSPITFSGIASAGIDTSSLIKAILDQERTARVQPLEDKVSALEDTNSAFSQLKSKLNTLAGLASKFRAINGGGLSKTAASSNESVLSASAASGAAPGNYAITVSSLAQIGSSSFNDRFSSTTAVINSSIDNGSAAANRTVSVTIGTGVSQETVDVVLDSTTTIDQFVTSYNSSATKSYASLVNVGTAGSPSYAISISSNQSGTEAGTISISVGSEIITAGSGALATRTTTQATDASLTISGISGSITRGSNTITDLISGVTFDLQGLGTSTVSVKANAAGSINEINDFVDAYNDILSFIEENDLVVEGESDSGRTNIFGPLARTSLDEGLLSAIREGISAANSPGSAVSILAELGITTQRDGTLAFDQDRFKNAVGSDANGVANVLQSLGESLTATATGRITSYTRFGGIIDTEMNSNISQLTDFNQRLQDIEGSLARREQALVAQFARLESLMGSLNQQQSALASITG